MLSSVTVRQWLSPLVAVLFTAIAVTGILMWLHVRVPGIKGLHEFGGLAFALVGLVHLASNWRALVAYFRKTQAWIALGAGAIACAVLLVGGAFGGEDHDEERGGRERRDRRGAQSASTANASASHERAEHGH
jgi:hypothetical protein